MKIIEPHVMLQMQALFEAGNGIRATAKAVGLHRDTVAKYYHLGEKKRCPCGKPMTHKGWCSSRVARSPGRQTFLARFSTVKTETEKRWVNLKEANDRRADLFLVDAKKEAERHRKELARENASLGASRLIEIVRDAIYRRCVPQIIEDVEQDLLEILWLGNLDARELKTSPVVGSIINKNYRLLLPASNVSLNDPFGDGRESFLDSLPSDTPLFNEAAVTK